MTNDTRNALEIVRHFAAQHNDTEAEHRDALALAISRVLREGRTPRQVTAVLNAISHSGFGPAAHRVALYLALTRADEVADA